MLDTMSTRICFIGGACSSAAVEAVGALRHAGYDVIANGCDPRENAVFMQADVPIVRSRIEALTDADVILTCYAHPEDGEDLYMGDNGLIELARPETYLIDLSVNTPRLAQEIHAMASVNDLIYIDAPLLNMGEGEDTVCFVGGDPKAADAIGVLLPYLAGIIQRQDSPGEGMLAACLAVIGLAGTIMGAIEAISIAKICNFKTRNALGALAGTGAASRALIDYVPQVLENNFDGRFAVYEFLNMLDVALLMSEELSVTLPMTETAYQLYDLLGVVGGDELNIQALALLYEDEEVCAKHGLDWALAEDVAQQRYAEMFGGEPGDDQIGQAIRDLSGSLQAQLSATGAMGTGDADLDDYRNHHVRKDDGDDNGDDGFPLAGNFFSKN